MRSKAGRAVQEHDAPQQSEPLKLGDPDACGDSTPRPFRNSVEKEFLYVAVLVLSVFALGAWAQNPVPHQHSASPPNLIDGSKNPELIPDSTAYRVVLLDLSLPSNSSDLDRRRQASLFGDIGLTPSETLQFNTVLAEFRSKYDACVQRWNAAGEAADKAGLDFDPALYVQQLEDLVQSTRSDLARQPILNLKVAGYVQHQKHGIQIQKGAN